ncbi:MAG TPA: SUMF1/EgtB/PvdO family nonheme iron enzyme [Terriglobia bacterium]|nr:SUMF1/EgtB/PvdO family nonheme iron enzyme [Terriglobia bacterium]
MAHQVFISYASADKTVADRVCSALEGAGISCWIAPRDIEPGTDFPAAIVEAIHSAHVLALVLTERAAASPHILSEVGHAFNAKKRIIPFRISSAALPADLEYFLSMTQWLDAPEGCTDESLKRLTQAVLDALHDERTPFHLAPLRQRAKWPAVAIFTLTVAGGIIFYGKWRRSTEQTRAPGSLSTRPVTSPHWKTWVNPADGQNYVWIAPGTFTMGCSAADTECKDDEKPAHPVAIERGFWLGQTEVTVAAYRKYAAKHGLESPAGDGNLPISGVTWAQAKEYCAAVGGRLPTEAEWEYAARGGNPQPYYGVVSEIAWYADNSRGAPHAVGKKQPNSFGLYDMLGNVAEWVLDRYYNKYYLDSPATGDAVEQPLPLASNHLAVARGGSFESETASLRVSRRFARENDMSDGTVGFRCVIDRP